MVINTFKSEIFLLPPANGTNLKILIPKQMLKIK